MTTTLLQQALQALETCTPGDYSTGHVIHPWHDDALIDAAADAIRAHLAAQPAPAEPVAHAQNPKDGFWVWCLADEPGAIPLYTHRAAQPAPVPVPPEVLSALEEARADSARRHQLLIIQHAEAVELWNALKDLSFECDGVTRVQAPSRETYNRTFALLRKKNHLSPEALRGYGESGVMQQSVQFAHGIAASPEVPVAKLKGQGS